MQFKSHLPMLLPSEDKRRGWAFRYRETPALSILLMAIQQNLALTDSEHLGAAGRTDPLRRWLAVLHGYGLGVLHLPLGATFHTISFHSSPPFGQTCTLRAHSLWPKPEDVKRGSFPQNP